MPHTIYERGPINDFILKGIKLPLRILLVNVVDRMPEPTRENTRHPNTHLLCDLREEFFRHENNKNRHKILRGVWNFLIVLYDYDAYYSDRIDWALEQWSRMDWQPRPEGHPTKHWWKE